MRERERVRRLCQATCIILIVAGLSAGERPVSATGLGNVHFEGTIDYPDFPCLTPSAVCDGGEISGTASGSISGITDNKSWNVELLEVSLSGEFSYRERQLETGWGCESPGTAAGTGSMGGDATGHWDGEDVTGVLVDFSFEWKRYPIFQNGGISALYLTLWADIVLLPQQVTVHRIHLFPESSSLGNGFGRMEAIWFPPVFVPCQEDATWHDDHWTFSADLMPTGLPLVADVSTLLVKTDSNEEELGGEMYWYCTVKPNAFPTQTSVSGGSSYGWRASGRVTCDKSVPHLGVTVEWERQGVNETGNCWGAAVLHDLATDPHHVEETRDEITMTVEDRDRAKCVRYYKHSDWVCPSYCKSITIFEIRFVIRFPDAVTEVDDSGTTITAKPVEGQEFCYTSPDDRATVECHYQYIELIRPN